MSKFPTKQFESRPDAESWLKSKRLTPSHASRIGEPAGYSAYLCYDGSGYTKFVIFVRR